MKAEDGIIWKYAWNTHQLCKIEKPPYLVRCHRLYYKLLNFKCSTMVRSVTSDVAQPDYWLAMPAERSIWFKSPGWIACKMVIKFDDSEHE